MSANPINRRHFVQTSAAEMTLIGARAADKPRRHALVGTGWSGKNDLSRLIQVEPVEIMALWDADQNLVLSKNSIGPTERSCDNSKHAGT